MGTLEYREIRMSHNHARVYDLMFELAAQDGRRYLAKRRTHELEKLEGTAQRPLLYDPANSSRACTLIESERPLLDSAGQLLGPPLARDQERFAAIVVLLNQGFLVHYLT